MERTNACFMFCSKGPREQIGCLASVCSCFSVFVFGYRHWAKGNASAFVFDLAYKSCLPDMVSV